MVLLVLALLVVYGVLGMLYESFVHPLTILSGLPSAGWCSTDVVVIPVSVTLYAFVGITARWDREEKCDHDDRLCAGARSEKAGTGSKPFIRLV